MKNQPFGYSKGKFDNDNNVKQIGDCLQWNNSRYAQINPTSLYLQLPDKSNDFQSWKQRNRLKISPISLKTDEKVFSLPIIGATGHQWPWEEALPKQTTCEEEQMSLLAEWAQDIQMILFDKRSIE